MPEAGDEGRHAARERALRRSNGWQRGRTVGLLAAVVAVAIFAWMVLVPGESADVAFAGDLRPDGRLEALRLPALKGGGTVDYASFSERPLVINFFASWCPNCIAEMPAFARVHKALNGRVAFLGISQSDQREASIELAHDTGVTYPTAIDERGAFFSALGALRNPVIQLRH